MLSSTYTYQYEKILNGTTNVINQAVTATPLLSNQEVRLMSISRMGFGAQSTLDYKYLDESLINQVRYCQPSPEYEKFKIDGICIIFGQHGVLVETWKILKKHSLLKK